jgi:hypothetical protein
MNTNVKVKLGLSHEQALKLKRAHQANRSVTIRLAHNQLFSSNGIEVELTNEQYKKCLSAYRSVKNPRGCQITFETHQVGGIFPFLIPLLAALGGIGAKVVPMAVRAAAAAAKVGATVAKAAPQIAKVGAKVVANPTVRTLAKGVATGVATAAGEQALSAVISKIQGQPAQPAPAEAVPVQEGQGFFYPSSQLGRGRGRKGGSQMVRTQFQMPKVGKGMRPIGSGLVPLGSKRGQGLITYASKKKASR